MTSAGDEIYFSGDRDYADRRYELVMPFVLCESEGGPYDDQSFVAGWELGQLDKEVEIGNALGASEFALPLFRTANLKQAQLIAMRYDYGHVEFEPLTNMPEWGLLTIRRSA